MNPLRWLGRSLVTVLLGAAARMAVPAPVRTAGLEPVTSFGTNPGNLSM